MKESINILPDEIQLQIADDEGMFDKREIAIDPLLTEMKVDEIYELQISIAEWEGMKSLD